MALLFQLKRGLKLLFGECIKRVGHRFILEDGKECFCVFSILWMLMCFGCRRTLEQNCNVLECKRFSVNYPRATDIYIILKSENKQVDYLG